MIRNSCAACGREINRTDHFFEASDGTLCQDCKTRLAPLERAGFESGAHRDSGAPAWAILPELTLQRHRHG